MSREEVFEFFEVLAEDGVIVEDGTGNGILTEY